MGRLTLSVLGGFQAQLPSGRVLSLRSKKGKALLAYLALRPEHAHSRESLAALLWPDSAEGQARHSLRQSLVALRKAVGRTATQHLRVDGETVSLAPAAITVDARALEELAAGGTPEALARAAALYRGDLLEGFDVGSPPFEEWLRLERQRCRELAVHALDGLLQHHVAAEAIEPAIQTAVRLLAIDPLQERVHSTLMTLYARGGRVGAALAQYQTCVDLLSRELGVEPDPATRRLRDEMVRERGPASLAGRGEANGRPVRAPRPRRRFHRRSTYEPPLVGRTHELGRLRQALTDVHRGHGRVIVVVGDAGIGKSRLVEELARESRNHGHRVLVGRAYESAQILAFGPWVDALRAGRVIDSADALQGLPIVWRLELGRLFPELGTPVAERPGGREDVHRLFEALVRVIEHLASARPLTLVLEDLHWADTLSRRLLSYVGRRIGEWSVMLVATARDDEPVDASEVGQWAAELTREAGVVELPLGPLSSAETAALVRALAPAGPDAALRRLDEQVWRLSDGNPFMIVETVRALCDGDVLRVPQRVPIPEKVRRLVAGRFRRLSERGRRALEVAAVLGHEFPSRLLARAAGLNDERAARTLEELVDRRMLRSVDERFRFAHDYIRHVVYSGLLPPRRTLLHRRVAAAIEARAQALPAAQREYGTLAHHFELGEERAKAVEYFVRAGERARIAYLNDDAIRLLERARGGLAAIAAGAAAPGWRTLLQTRLHESLGDVRLRIGKHEEAVAEYEAALRDCAGDARLQRSRLHRKIARGHYMQRRYAAALAAYAAAEAALGTRADGAPWWREWVAVQLDRMWLHYWTAEPDEIARLAASSRAAVKRYATPAQRAHFFHCLTLMAHRRDRYVVGADTLDNARTALAASRESGDPTEIGTHEFGLGFTHLWHGDAPEAEAHLHAALALAERTGEAVLHARALTYLAIGWRLRGRVDDARRFAERALEAAAAAGTPEYSAAARATLAWIAWREGNTAESGEQGRAAVKTWQTLPAAYPFQWIAILPLLAVALERGELADAAGDAEAALAPSQQRLPPDLTRTLEDVACSGDGLAATTAAAVGRAVGAARRGGLL